MLLHGSGETRLTIDVSGRTRSFVLFQPVGLSASVPLVIALHGRLGTGSGMEKLTHFEAIAEREKFLLIYPDGVKKSWNDGRGTPESTGRFGARNRGPFFAGVRDPNRDRLSHRRAAGGMVYAFLAAGFPEPRDAELVDLCSGGGLISVLIALATVSSRALRAATANPVQALKTD
jgi:hypothetical protein